MTVDYDAPRRTESDDSTDSVSELASPRDGAQAAVADVEDVEALDAFELPGADLSDEEFVVRVIPKQADEFTCSSCFLVHHRSRLASQVGGHSVCAECA
jgi:predicted component of type VI protein secretion system